MRDVTLGVLLSAGWLIALTSCTEDLAEGACESPGSSQECACPDGRSSVQTCSAYGVWGACYCYRPGCGNGEIDDGEACDDGNTADGDGCSAMCVTEPGGAGGSGPGGSGPATTATTTTTSTGGMGGAPATGGGGTGGTSTGGSSGGSSGGGSGGGSGGAGGA